MSGDVAVRPVRPGDGQALARAWLDAGRYYAGLDPETFQVPDAEGLAEFFEQVVAREREPNALRVVAEVGGRVVGSAMGRIEDPLDSARYLLQRQLARRRLVVDVVVVDEAFRRQGVGGRLMAALEAWGRERGATVALLETYPESALSLPFFQEWMGYRRSSARLSKPL